MANEAILVQETGLPITLLCADGTGIAKGEIMQLTSPRTVSASSGDNETFGGIAKQQKVASDGQTECAVYFEGVFILKDSGAGFSAGEFLKLAGANTVATADDAGALGANETVGMALEDAGAGETAHVLVGRC